MDYEKKYNEALKWMRELYPGLHGATKEDAEHYFPELRESEDERIIRAIIDALYSHTNSINLLSSRGYQMENIEAWLEKQKYDRMKPIYDARESFESALEKAWNDYHNGYENVDKFEDDYVECAHAKGFREGYLFGIEKRKEQKPMEWSEGERIRQKLIHIVKKYRSMVLDGDDKAYDDCLAYLEVRKEQKPAWSEEDEKMRNLAIEWAETMYGQFRFVDMGSTDFRKIVAWLKSLHPSWKPNEEDLEIIPLMIAILKQNYRPDSMFGRSGKGAILRDCLIARLESLENHINNL